MLLQIVQKWIGVFKLITLDEQSRIPIYEQIINEVKRNVIEGFLKPKDQIPSIRELATTLGINPNTVKKSYTALENQNIIQSKSTKGTFISAKIDHILQDAINTCYNNIETEIETLKNLGISQNEILERIKVGD